MNPGDPLTDQERAFITKHKGNTDNKILIVSPIYTDQGREDPTPEDDAIIQSLDRKGWHIIRVAKHEPNDSNNRQ